MLFKTSETEFGKRVAVILEKDPDAYYEGLETSEKIDLVGAYLEDLNKDDWMSLLCEMVTEDAEFMHFIAFYMADYNKTQHTDNSIVVAFREMLVCIAGQMSDRLTEAFQDVEQDLHLQDLVDEQIDGFIGAA